MKPHRIRDLDNPNGATIAWVHPASPEAVQKVLAAETTTGDGRSEWIWLRLPNGDLILGVFPQGDTYCDMEKDAQYPGDDEAA